MFDRASTRTRETLVNRFITTSTRLNPAPGVNPAAVPRNDMLLIMMQESMDRSQVELNLHTSGMDAERMKALISAAMNNQFFRDAFNGWTRDQGLKLQSAGEASLPTLSSPAASTAAAAASLSSASSTDAASDPPSPVPRLMALHNNVTESMDMETLYNMGGL
jgi:hypothetical protein